MAEETSAINSRVRGTPIEVSGHPARLILVLSTLFFSFPALLIKPLGTLDGATAFPDWLVCFCLLGGAGAWATASFMASSAWLSFTMAAFIGTGLELATRAGLAADVSSTTILHVVLVLLAAGVLSMPALTRADAVVVVGLAAAAGHGLATQELSVEVRAVLSVLLVALLSAPGVVGHDASRTSAALALVLPAGVVGLLTSAMNLGSPSSLVLGLLLLLLAFVRYLGLPPEPTPSSRQMARASRYLLAGLLASLVLLRLDGSTAGLAVLMLVLAGASCALIVTCLLASTAHTWGPVRSGEYQMVTVDFLALLLYFVMPLATLLYLAYLQLPALPPAMGLFSTVTDALPQLQPGTLALAVSLSVLLVFTQESFEESSILWAHWLISTYTYGALDSKNVALVARIEPLLKHVNDPSELPSLLKGCGLGPLNLFASYDVAAAYPEVLQALAKDGHVLGTETAAGPFTPLLSAYQEVQSVFDVVRAACGGVEPKWYLGSGGHRNPWALIKAAALKQSLVAPALVVRLGPSAGSELTTVMDAWYHGGIVFVDAEAGGEGVDMRSVLNEVKGSMTKAGYKAVGLEAVCQKVQKMLL